MTSSTDLGLNRSVESRDVRPTLNLPGSWFKRAFSLNQSTRLKIESVLLGLAILFAVIWFATPSIARHYINRSLSGLPDYDGRVEQVRIHPWNASFDLYDLHLDKRSNEIPVHYFYSPRWHISLEWSQIMHGVLRNSVSIYRPRINLVAGPDKAQSQIAISGVWINAIKQIIPFRVNQVNVIDGELHFLDFHADPKIDLVVDHVDLTADNISNSERRKVPLPTTVKITGHPLSQGYFEMNMAINFEEKYATFNQNFKMENVPAVGANSALGKYLKVEAKSGDIALYSELTGDKGIYHGYVKPFFYQLEFEPKPDDKGTPGAIWSGILNAIKGLFENKDKTIATEAPISGRVDQPQVDVLSAIGGVLWNAYIQAIATGFDAKNSPPQPADTITTPQAPAQNAH